MASPPPPDGTACQGGMVGTPPNCSCPPSSELLGGNCVRYTATTDPKIRDFPEGTIDPLVRLVSFWDGERPAAVLSYYATHPQSYYYTGKVSADDLLGEIFARFCIGK